MGVVYEALQISLNRRVASKLLPQAAALDARHLQGISQRSPGGGATASQQHCAGLFRGLRTSGAFLRDAVDRGADLAQVITEIREGTTGDGQREIITWRHCGPDSGRIIFARLPGWVCRRPMVCITRPPLGGGASRYQAVQLDAR